MYTTFVRADLYDTRADACSISRKSWSYNLQNATLFRPLIRKRTTVDAKAAKHAYRLGVWAFGTFGTGKALFNEGLHERFNERLIRLNRRTWLHDLYDRLIPFCLYERCPRTSGYTVHCKTRADFILVELVRQLHTQYARFWHALGMHNNGEIGVSRPRGLISFEMHS
jgi:hypothetical protein